jgi:hypothetical protein
MKREKVDVLLMQNNNDHMGGYVKYFTDMPATNGYPNTVVFPADDEMTVVMQGPFGGDRKPEPDIWRGVKRVLTTPSYESAHFTQYYDPELAAKALRPFAKGTIGLVGTYQMSFAMGDTIMKKFPRARYVDAERAGQSRQGHQERRGAGLIRRAAIMQDGAMKGPSPRSSPACATPKWPRLRCTTARIHGSENGIYLCASRRSARRPSSASAMCRTRTIRKGRHVRAAGGGLRARRHVHRAWPLVRARQGAAADEGRA